MHTVLIALLLLQIKHFIGDFVLQSARQSRFKSGYGHRAGLEHAGIHAVLTLPCLLGVGVALTPAVITAAAEFVVHYHGERNHQGLGNQLIHPERRSLGAGTSVSRRQRLGGMLNFYHPAAA